VPDGIVFVVYISWQR